MINKLSARQALVVALLFAGYASYYFCRSDLSVAMPMLADALHRQGMPREMALIRLGGIVSYGVLAYGVGKLLLSGLGDFWGGRKSFLGGLAGAIVFTLLFTLTGGLPIFTLAWIGNRLVQSMGWAGLVKVCSQWFSYTSYGTVIAIVSLSFLVGDAKAREWMGVLIASGYGWRSLFYLAALVSSIVFALNFFFLAESRVVKGFSAPLANPLNVFGQGTQAGSGHYFSRVKPLLINRGFLIVCFLSLCTTIVRETFNTWTPTYLHIYLRFGEGASASFSAIFPAAGAISVIIAGTASDRLGAYGREILLFTGLLFATVSLLWMGTLASGTQGSMPMLLIGMVALGLLGPYSFLAGAIALDFGGKQGGATASGIIDGVGYLGGISAGDGVARLSVVSGWNSVFFALALLSSASTFAAGLLFLRQRQKAIHRLRSQREEP